MNKFKSFINLFFIPDSLYELSKTGMILTLAYLLFTQLSGLIFLSSIPYDEIHSYQDTIKQFLVILFCYFLTSFSFFYFNTVFVEWILQIILSKSSTLKQFYSVFKGLFVFFLCMVGVIIVFNLIHPIYTCGCINTNLDNTTINTIE